MDMSRLWKPKAQSPPKAEATKQEQLEMEFRKALPQKTSFRQMWQTLDSSEKMKQPRIKVMISTALSNAIDSLDALTDDTVSNLEIILDKSSAWHNIHLTVLPTQILGKFLQLGTKPRPEVLDRLDRMTLASITKPDYLSAFADFVKTFHSELPEDKLLETLSLVAVHIMATFQSVEEGSPYQAATLKFFKTVLEQCATTDRFLSENVLKALCLLYAYDEVWEILDSIVARLGIDLLLWQLTKVEQCRATSIFTEIQQGAIIYASRLALDGKYAVGPGICPLIFLSNIADFVQSGVNEDTLRRVLPLVSVFVDRDPTRLSAEWFYIWKILEAGHRLSKKHSQSETLLLDIISKACRCYEDGQYHGSVSQLSGIITYFRASLPEAITSMSGTLV